MVYAILCVEVGGSPPDVTAHLSPPHLTPSGPRLWISFLAHLAHPHPRAERNRWHKLLKSFYNEKKDRFDISKVPDIYDSAKYDAIHNAHLGLDALEVSRPWGKGASEANDIAFDVLFSRPTIVMFFPTHVLKFRFRISHV